MSVLSPGKRLRQAVAGTTIQVPGAFNALAARMIQRAGFPAMYLSGAAFSAGTLALPDVGLFSLTELVDQTRQLARSVDLLIDVSRIIHTQSRTVRRQCARSEV